MNTETIAGITYSKPQVILLQETGIGTSEVAARTCYDSFNNSENEDVKDLNRIINNISLNDTPAQNILINQYLNGTSLKKRNGVNNIEHSDLLDTLAWTHFHHSILEHSSLTYLIKGTSRGVLQEHARHRIQAISVRSTRYTMQNILHAFNACSLSQNSFAKSDFINLIIPMQMFVVQGEAERIEIESMYDRLFLQLRTLGRDNFIKLTMSKSAQDIYDNRKIFKSPKELFNTLCDTKSKRNVGDNFKWIVTDNWKVDMVVTFNLRSLKNYFTLRDSGAAYFGIRHLAQAMKDVTPSKYLNLIVKT